MDNEENEDQLINRNSSKGKRAAVIVSDDEDVEDYDDESGSEEEDGLEEEEGEDEDAENGSESEEDEDDEDDEQDTAGGSSALTQSGSLLNDGQSSDEDTENCPICLNGFRNQVVGTPENCNHYFCLDCIIEWSKNANSCPVDRITFSCIHIRAHFGGDILKKVPVQNKAEVAEEEDATNCEVCGRSDREDRLLLCDGCDAGYHMECLTPPLNAIPVDEWFCPECADANQPDEDHVSEEEVAGLLADVVPTTSRLRTNVVRTRAIARTRQSERVRANVNRNRISTARNIQDTPGYLALLDDTIEAVVSGLSTAVYQRPLTPRVVTRKRKKKAGRKKTSQSKVPKGAQGVRKKRRRRFKRRKGRKQMTRKMPTAHSRIAKSLGMCNPLRGSTLPRMHREPEQTLGSMRHDIGTASLSVFGNAYDLDPFESNEEEESNPVSPLTAKRRVLSRSALRSHQPVARPIAVGLSRGGRAPPVPESVAVAEPVPDLLGSILSGQSMLMMKSSDIVIRWDGSLSAKKPGESSLQKNSSPNEELGENNIEPCSSRSGSPAIASSASTWKSTGQHPQLKFPSSGLYSLSPSPSPPPSSPSGLERLSMPTPGTLGTSAFRLKNAFTPRAVQVQSSASRFVSKHAEPHRFNGTLHKLEPPSSSNTTQSKRLDAKHPIKPPTKRLDISELPRIPKIKKETDQPIEITSKHSESSKSTSRNNSVPSTCINKLTGRGDSHQLGRFNTTDNRMKGSRQDSQEQHRHSVGVSSSHSSSSSGTSLQYSSGSKSLGSPDGGGGLRITISGGSDNSCRLFSPSAKDPFRAEGKTTQKAVSPQTSTSDKKEKPIKNEIYDPFDPTGSDSGSLSSSPERPGSTSVASTETTIAPQTSGAKVGAFRSFRFLAPHSSKVGVSKLGPDFSDLSPSNKAYQESTNVDDMSPVLSSYIKVEKEIKKEVVQEEETEQTPFRITCPLSGLKITSDLKPGGSRGFRFDVEEQELSVKTELDNFSNRVIHQNTGNNRLVWEAQSPSQSLSSSSSRGLELQRKEKTVVKDEPKVCLSFRSRTRSQERESRSASSSSEEEKEKKSKSKSHREKREHSDRSSSGSCERSRKKRQKEKKKEKKRRNPESKERKRSRSSSHSSSSHRMYNSKKKKKKKRGSRSGSRSRSISPEKDRRRKHRTEKSYSTKDRGLRVKEKKKPKDERERLRSKSPQMIKEHKAHRSKEKRHHFTVKEILQTPDREENTAVCTVSVQNEYYLVKQDIKTSSLIVPKEEVDSDSDPSFKTNMSIQIKQEKEDELSEKGDVSEIETNSPPWSPSLLDSLLSKETSKEASELLFKASVLPIKEEAVSPQDPPSSTATDPPSPKFNSPHSCPSPNSIQPTTIPVVQTEADDLQWSPSHLDDFLLNELSDEVCSVAETSPDDVDLEEAIMMKHEDHKETPTLEFAKNEIIPFLQDNGNTIDEGAGNAIKKVKEKKNDAVKEEKPAIEITKTETVQASVSKTKPQVKRVTWNLQEEDAGKSAEKSTSVPFYKLQRVKEEPWSPKLTDSPPSRFNADSPSQSPDPLPWDPTDTPLQDSVSLPWNNANKPIQVVSQMPWNAMDRPRKEANQLPWIATDTPIQVFPQTLPPLPLPPIFPTYAPVSEPTVPCVMQGSLPLLGSGEMLSQTPKLGSLATAREPKIQAANTGEGKGKSKSAKKGEKGKNEEYMKKLHMQERAVEEVKLAIKPFYQKREITKEEYKEILRKAVQKICHSKSGEINPVKVVNLVKAYVDRYKHLRKHKKSEGDDEPYSARDSPV
ncbi:LOW QUALITY PROTEIN: PHD and RING finger domain-containing protein 1 [Discoglossus pictus]